MNPKQWNIIVGSIYKYLLMDLTDVNSNYLKSFLEEISKEQKSVSLLDDCNINLLNHNNHQSLFSIHFLAI